MHRRIGSSLAMAMLLVAMVALAPRARAQQDAAPSLNQLKAPVCMSADELVAYQTMLSQGTVSAILERCKASFSGELDADQIGAIEQANKMALERPGVVMKSVDQRAREPFKRAYGGRAASTFADVLSIDLRRIMNSARPETLASCRQVIGLWAPKVAENKWEEALATFGETTFKRNVIRRRRAFEICE